MDTQLSLFPNDDTPRQAKPKLVGFAGRAGSGKSVCSSVFVQNGWKLIKFADGLKNMLRSLYVGLGMPHDQIERRIEGDLKETPDMFLSGRSPRHAMQTLGDEWGRQCMFENFWVNHWLTSVRASLADGYSVVVDDVRYSNEAQAIRDLGGQIIMVARGDAELVSPVHASERFEFKSDDLILNEGSVSELMEKARRVLHQ